MMIISTVDLSDEQAAEIRDLISICEKYDNAKMCIQMDHSLNFLKELKSWILYYHNKQLAGIASIFSPMINEAEISICVDPQYRKNGIAKKLAALAYEELSNYNISTVLFVCDRNSKTGMDIIKNKGLPVHHTEYTLKCMYYGDEDTKNILVRTADENDVETIVNILTDVFDDSVENAKTFIENSIKSESRKGFIGMKGNKNIGIAFVGYNECLSINTFGIIKEERRKGYGKELIRSIIHQIKDPNKDIIIDVDSNNITAYKLYKSLGFKEILTIDYYIHSRQCHTGTDRSDENGFRREKSGSQSLPVTSS